MKKVYWKTAFAYIGVIIGAGLSSGQDLLQYFLCFGEKGLAGVALLGILNIIFGKIMVTMGCYYRADNHEEVFSEITHPIVTRALDIVLVIGSFVMGFVMIAGAGANLYQQFSLVPWLGSLICSVLIVLVAFLNFDKITGVLGVFTPVMIVMILLITAYTFIGKSYNFNELNTVAKTITPAINNVWLSAINYYALCAMTGVSMAFILGGSMVRIGNAEKGGFIGGLLIGVIVMTASLTLFARIDVVKGADMPMLAIVNDIHPLLAFVYAITVFALIFNTAFSLYYSIARRFSGGSPVKTKKLMIIIVTLGYLCSFGGFKKLIGLMYPILGYMGMLLMAVLLIGWLREKPKITMEKHVRRKMIRISLKKLDPRYTATNEEKDLFHDLAAMSPADTESLQRDVKITAKDIFENSEDVKSFAEKELSVDNDRIHEAISQKKNKNQDKDV